MHSSVNIPPLCLHTQKPSRTVVSTSADCCHTHLRFHCLAAFHPTQQAQHVPGSDWITPKQRQQQLRRPKNRKQSRVNRLPLLLSAKAAAAIHHQSSSHGATAWHGGSSRWRRCSSQEAQTQAQQGWRCRRCRTTAAVAKPAAAGGVEAGEPAAAAKRCTSRVSHIQKEQALSSTPPVYAVGGMGSKAC